MPYSKQILILTVFISYGTHSAHAATPGGANAPYKVETDTLDGGGKKSTSDPYTNYSSVGGIHFSGTSTPYAANHGYYAQLDNISGSIIDLNGPDGSGLNFSVTFTEGDSPRAVSDSDATIDLKGSTGISSGTIRISNLLNGTKEAISVNTGGTSVSAAYNANTGILTLSNADSKANYEAVIRSTVYSNSSQNPNTTARKITFNLIDDQNRASSQGITTVTVRSVNDAPTFTLGGNQSVQDTAGPQSIVNFATGIGSGNSEESGQTISFTTTNNNNALFTVQPSVSTNGTLTFTPKKFATGTATISVTLTDNGNTANGGVNKTTKTFTINVATNSQTLMVINTNDSGAGSLREMLSLAIKGDRILFDPDVFNVNNPTDQTKIKPQTQLPALDKSDLFLDASAVKVILDGSVIEGASCGLLVTSSGNTIQGLTIQDFNDVGFCIRDGAQNNLIGGDRSKGTGSNGQGLRISRNGNVGFEISGVGTSNNTVKGCWIGISANGSEGEANDTGLVIKGGATNNTIGGTTQSEANVISGNAEEGIAIFDEGTDGNNIIGNLIGSAAGASRSNDSSRKLTNFIPLGNGGSGIGLSTGTKNNKVGGKKGNEPNIIADNGKLSGSTESGHGVSVRDAGTERNSIRQNSILLNQKGGIGNIRGGNQELEPPKKTSVLDNGASASDTSKRSAILRGTSTAGVNSEVDLFNDEGSQGEEFLGTAIVLGDGTWEATVDLDTQKNVTATVTSTTGNTSAFTNFGKGLQASKDSDNDGFPDNVEVAAGTDPNNGSSTPFGGSNAPAITPVTGLKLLVKLNFKLTGKDGIKVLGPLPVPAGFDPAGKKVIVDIGGVIRSYTLDAKGKSPKGTDFFKVKASKKIREAGGNAKFLFGLKLGTLTTEFLEEGMDNVNTPKIGTEVVIPVRIYFEGQVLGADVVSLYKAKQGKKGLAKSKK